MATVLAAKFRGSERGTDQFLDALVKYADSLQRDGKTLQVNLRGGGDNADVYGLAIEYPQTDIGLSLLDSDSEGLAKITTAVNAARPMMYITQGLPRGFKGRWTEADTIVEGYTTDPSTHRVRVTIHKKPGLSPYGFQIPGYNPDLTMDALEEIQKAPIDRDNYEHGERVGTLVFRGDPQGDLRVSGFEME